MSKTCFTIAEQKMNVINFIKKHKDILGLDDGRKAITTEYLDKLKNANNADFFYLAQKVQSKFRRNFYIFSVNYDKKLRMIEIWLPATFSKSASDKAIKKFCGDHSLAEVIEGRYCRWYNMTPQRWKTFEAIFDFYDKPKASKKIVKQKEVKLSDSAIVKDDIVFIDFEAKEFDHLMNQGSSSLVFCIDSKSECNAKNQIDHLINAFKLAKKEAETFIELLENAKKQGAKHVVDSDYIKVTEFNFAK